MERRFLRRLRETATKSGVDERNRRPATPAEIKRQIDAAHSQDFQELEPRFPPTDEAIQEKGDDAS